MFKESQVHIHTYGSYVSETDGFCLSFSVDPSVIGPFAVAVNRPRLLGGSSEVATGRKWKRTNFIHNDAKKGRRRRRRKGKGKKQGRMEIYGGAINQLRSDVTSIYRLLNVEDKHIDTNASATITTGAWNTDLLNGMTMGNGSTNRIGQSVKSVGYEIRYTLNINPLNTATCEFVRLVVFIDKQSNGTAATFNNVFVAGTTTLRVDGFIDHFAILEDKVISVSPNSNEGAVGIMSGSINFHVSFNSGNAGTIADIDSNALWLMWNSSLGTNAGTFTYNARYVFIDN